MNSIRPFASYTRALFGIILFSWCMVIMPEKNNYEAYQDDDLEFYDAQQDPGIPHKKNTREQADDREHYYDVQDHSVSSDRAAAIVEHDEYSGYDPYLDEIYQYAKRNVYLAQEHKRLFPESSNESYRRAKKYCDEVAQQRKNMATIQKQIQKIPGSHRMSPSFSDHVRTIIEHLKEKQYEVYSQHVSRPTHAKNSARSHGVSFVFDSKVPDAVQLRLNSLRIEEAQIILREMLRLHKLEKA